MAFVNTVVNKGLLEIAKEFLELVTSDLDKHTSKKGVVKIEGNTVVLLTPAHIQWAKFGRGPGKQPPIDEMLDFVKQGRIKFKGQTEEGTAFVIAKSIGKKGTKGFTKNAPNAIEEQITKSFESYNKKLSQMLTVGISDEVNKTFTEIIPEGIKKFKI
ncbi:MAG: hypothetical protein QQN55_03670 [Nitrosopumilus sp.]